MNRIKGPKYVSESLEGPSLETVARDKTCGIF